MQNWVGSGLRVVIPNVSRPEPIGLSLASTRAKVLFGSMAQPIKYAIQVRPTEYLKDPASYNWILAADTPAEGLCIEVTDFIELADPAAACSAVVEIAEVIRASSSGSNSLWKVTSDGGSKAVSMPQRGVETETVNSWFLNLCCLQGTLGQVAAQIFYHPDLMDFRNNLFPNLQTGAYAVDKDNLGAWQITLDPSPDVALTRTQALALRSRIIQEIESWTLVLISKQDPNAPGIPVYCPMPADLNAGTAQLYVADLKTLPPSLYPPSGQKCEEENARPLGPFPPGSCAPPYSGGDSCYFPVRGYPNCCFRRMNYPLLRYD